MGQAQVEQCPLVLRITGTDGEIAREALLDIDQHVELLRFVGDTHQPRIDRGDVFQALQANL